MLLTITVLITVNLSVPDDWHYQNTVAGFSITDVLDEHNPLVISMIPVAKFGGHRQ